VRCAAYVVVVVACFGPIACTSSGNKSSSTGSAAAAAGGPAAVAQTGGVKAAPAGVGGLLAGQVIDSFYRRPSTASIQVVAMKDGQQAGAPIEVACDTQGYFTIQGLQPGLHYQLTARVKDSGRVLSGQVLATPPDPRLLIRVSEDFTTSITPDLPAPPAYSRGSGVELDRPRPSAPGVELGPPARGNGAAQASPAVPVRPDSRIEIPNQSGPASLPAPGAATVRSTDDSASTRPRAPFCTFSGNRVDNFGLDDLNGGTWEFRGHRGRLVLLDFWGTWCSPCREAIPHLKILDQLYRPYGLEVVGIAYESGKPSDQVRKVSSVADRMQIGYRLLLGSGKDVPCPVRDQFQIAAYPTLILLDETGRILWRSEQGVDRQQLHLLETEIRRRLTQR
jgi:thiol-disulfide isomerase/thioredoxin